MRDRESEPAPITFRELAQVLWSGRWLVLATTVVFTALAVTVAWILPNKYDATVLLSPVNAQSQAGGMGALSSAMSQLSGVALLAGLGLGGSGGAKAEAVATLQSEILTTRYIQDNDLLPVLFSKKWDPVQKKWMEEDPRKVPTLWTGNLYFSKKIRKVTENAKTGLVTLTVTWKDAKLAAQWANDLVKLTNEYLRDKAIQESERNIAYLSEQARKTTVVELRNAIYTLMESEIKKQMVARGSIEYALKVVDPAAVPEREASPQRLLLVAGGFFIGLMFGMLVAAARYVFRQPDAARS